MIRNVVLALVSLLVTLVPAQAMEAQAARPGVAAPPVGARPPGHQLLNHHSPNRPSFNHHPLHRYPLFPYWGNVVYAPPAWFGSSASYAPAPVYESPGLYSQPAGSTLTIASAPPPMPGVIPFPTGRYELWGDGLTSPYQWVWIPNPPASPPMAPPVGTPAPSTPQAAEPAAPPRSKLYRWVDDEGIVNWTQGLDTVPEKYRAQLTQRRPS